MDNTHPEPYEEAFLPPGTTVTNTSSSGPVANEIISGLSVPPGDDADDEASESSDSDSDVTLQPGDGTVTLPLDATVGTMSPEPVPNGIVTAPLEPVVNGISTTHFPAPPGDEADDEDSNWDDSDSDEAGDGASEFMDSEDNVAAQAVDANDGWGSDGNSTATTESSDGDTVGGLVEPCPTVNRALRRACLALLRQPREIWADHLDTVFDPDCLENGYHAYPETRQLLSDVCRGVADARRGGTGYFKPWLYRPCSGYGREVTEGPDLYDRGPDPYDDGPGANYHGWVRGRPTATHRYHFNKAIWDHCDDLLNLAPEHWMASLPGLVQLIFNTRIRVQGPFANGFSRLMPDTHALLEAMRAAFDGVPPPDIPGRMSRCGKFFEVDSGVGSLDSRDEIVVPAWMTRAEMLASIPARARHILMYGRPMPDRRLEARPPVTCLGAEALDVADYSRHTYLREFTWIEVTEQEHAVLEDAFGRLMATRKAALAHHDAIDKARVRYRAELARANRPLALFMEEFRDSPNVV